MHLNKFLLFLIIGIFLQNFVLSQNSNFSGIPEGLKNKSIAISATIELNDSNADFATDKNLINKKTYLKSLKVANNIPVNINPKSIGYWQKIGNKRIWTCQVKVDNAVELGLSMDNISLKENEQIFIYNNYGVLGSYTKDNSYSSMSFPPLIGNNLIIEFSTPNKPGYEGVFTINAVADYLKNVSWASPIAGSCNYDINCPIGNNWQVEKRAVTLLIINTYSGTLECTGTIINNTSFDAKPYLLTAHHCISSEYDADNTLIFFNFESNICGGNGDNANIATDKQVLYGGKLISTSYDYDFTLIELNQHPPMEVMPYYAGWDLNTTSNTDTVTTIHHPEWSVKKISQSFIQPVTSTYNDGELSGATNAYWKIPHWNMGVTEPGSSGSALFNTEHKIIGTLTGGGSACGDSSLSSDYYEKFSSSYQAYSDTTQQLKRWLDPLNKGVTSLDGFDPFPITASNCDTLSNLLSGEKTMIVHYEFGKGYYSGTNSDSITTYAEKFTNSDSAYLTGANFHLGRLNSSGGLIIQVYGNDLVPTNLLYETYQPFSLLNTNSYNYIEFYPYVKLKGNFYIAYTIPYNGKDTFTMYQATPRYQDLVPYNTEYILYKNSWISFDSMFVSHSGSSLDIKPTLCSITFTDIKPLNTFLKIEIYPNPSHQFIKIKTPDKSNLLQFEIFDIYGRQVMSLKNYTSNSNINIENLVQGIYIVKVFQDSKNYSAKFIKTK